MEFITSSHGGVKLINDGFAYTKKAEKTNRIRWECSLRKSTGCKGAETTSLLRDDLHVTVPHNHPADVTAFEALKVMKTTMCDRVQDVRARPGQVLATGVASASQEVRVKIGRVDGIRRTLRRQRRGRPYEPPPSVAMDACGGAPAGRSIGDYSYHPGSPRTARILRTSFCFKYSVF